MNEPVYLNDLGIINALGCGKDTVRRNMLAGQAPGMQQYQLPLSGQSCFAGQVLDELPAIPQQLASYASRNSQLILHALRQIEPSIMAAIQRSSPARIGVVMGSSTGGIAETELALQTHKDTGSLPADFDYRQHEIGSCAEFVARYYQLEGPAYTISTACSSSAKVFASARGLITRGHCDAVIVGGADSLCELTVRGFRSLEAVADERSNPFSVNRKGINIGEAAAVFLMSREPRGVCLRGIGESSDAWHMSAPEPTGEGARRAMQAALVDAALAPADIGYLNLHGTGTKLNDAMESQAVHELFGEDLPTSSSKPMTGHTLGAAGATEAGLCWLLLTADDTRQLIPHLYDGHADPALHKITLCGNTAVNQVNHVLSNSFAFGGSNVSVVLSRLSDDYTCIPVEELVPHSPPMVLLERVLHYDGISLTAEFSITPQSMFYEEAIAGVPAWIGLEYMAQAVAALSGLRSRARNTPVKPGLLLGSRKVTLHEQVLRNGETCTVVVRQLLWDASGLANFDCQLFRGATLCVDARVNVFESDNINAMTAGTHG